MGPGPHGSLTGMTPGRHQMHTVVGTGRTRGSRAGGAAPFARGLRGPRRSVSCRGEPFPGFKILGARERAGRCFDHYRHMNTAAAKRARRRKRALAPGIVPGGRCSRCALCGPAGECRDGTAVKSGRCGDWVWYERAGHQWRRRWLKPFDPKTAKQRTWRAHLAAASKAYNELLTEEQQDACIAAGAKRQTRTRFGQSGPQTGQQYWVGLVCAQKPPKPKRQAGKRKS
jgi:hypothetical protein